MFFIFQQGQRDITTRNSEKSILPFHYLNFIFSCFSQDPCLIPSILQHLILAHSVEGKYYDYKITGEKHFFEVLLLTLTHHYDFIISKKLLNSQYSKSTEAFAVSINYKQYKAICPICFLTKELHGGLFFFLYLSLIIFF